MGSVAARLARADGIKLEPVPNVRYGVVNSMPEEYWMAAAKQIGLVAQPDAQAG
ncbi:hypothetical protein [Segniliparus rugosus]|uniref:hypothetical protein n=1 Tax=Segniliparus rugosus TaxID=286804 RepID=UPI001FCC8558|nr:hypothetical protein [Segniliparus rugosus]